MTAVILVVVFRGALQVPNFLFLVDRRSPETKTTRMTLGCLRLGTNATGRHQDDTGMPRHVESASQCHPSATLCRENQDDTGMPRFCCRQARATDQDDTGMPGTDAFFLLGGASQPCHPSFQNATRMIQDDHPSLGLSSQPHAEA